MTYESVAPIMTKDDIFVSSRVCITDSLMKQIVDDHHQQGMYVMIFHDVRFGVSTPLWYVLL